MAAIGLYILAALAEIGGCFAFWAVLRLGKPAWWLAPGVAALCLFAAILTRLDQDAAGRVYAAYGGIYIAASLAWLWVIDGRAPDRWDLIGSALALSGAAIIFWGPRSAA